jgi:hypothetical protein
LGNTVVGVNHDYGLFKKEFPPNLNLFAHQNVLVDLGYQGIATDYKLNSLRIPFKRPTKSKANPDPKLSQEKKEYNQSVGRVRVCVENALSGLKRYAILSVKYRGKSMERFDQTVELCAGLWNFKLNRHSIVVS